MTLVNKRNLPSVIEEDYFTRFDYIQPTYYTENPENTLAKFESLAYLDLLKDKIKQDHKENMTKIKSNHEEIMKGMQYSASNNYVAGLASGDRLKIKTVQVKPFVYEETWFGFQRKTDGITLEITRQDED